MKFTIDNLQGAGPLDYTAALDRTVDPQVQRKINQPSLAQFTLRGDATWFVPPEMGGRVIVAKEDGTCLFTGYLTQAPQAEYLGWGEGGAVYRYTVVAESDEILLDQKALPNRAPFVARTAGSSLKELVLDLLPGVFDTSAVQDVDVLASYEVNPQKKFSETAGEIAMEARGCYRAMNGAISFMGIGGNSLPIDESDKNFSPAGLALVRRNEVRNDLMVIGLDEPQAYVRDYFVGDGLSQRFYLSQAPFLQDNAVLIDEEYRGSKLDATRWAVSDPGSAIAVVAQALQVDGGTGRDGDTTVSFVEQVELGGAIELQHGDLNIAGPCNGVIGGLYSGAIAATGCLAGFRMTPNGSQSQLQAVIQGAATGPVISTTEGHRYVLTTYVYCREVYRSGETYRSSKHRAGGGLGGAMIPADIRLVLTVQDVNPASPGSMVAAATVLYDGVVANAPEFCRYVLVNVSSMQGSIAYTYARRISLAEVRTALPGGAYVTQPVGSRSDGAQCGIVGSTTLDFYPQYVPPLNTLIVASYRGYGRAAAEVRNNESIAELASETDDGVRGVVRTMKAPRARTQSDCESAAQAILDDATGSAWSGKYELWSDFLPGDAPDIFPGDTVAVNVPSQGAVFDAVARAVAIRFADPADDRGHYVVEFANEAAESLALRDEASNVTIPLQDHPALLTTAQVGTYYLDNLTDAQIVSVSSTTVTVDVGMAVPSGCGVEVRMNDYGWGVSNDRNLLGRFNSQTFTLPRLARTQTYWLRLYDQSSPPRYSRYAAALHLDYPL
jgi:hypothetical protein